jgi:tetratricopeptide (TPR) repeat protein
MSRLQMMILMATVIIAGCARRVSIPVAALQPSTPEDRVLYERGIAAFRESTPEGYSRASELFHRAMLLVPANCEYALNFAQANLFLALEQEANLDDFKPALNASATPACGLNTPFALRLEAFRALPEFQPGKERAATTGLIEQASRSEMGNPLNWYVSWRLSPTQRQAPELYEGIKVSEANPNLALTYYELGSFWILRNRQAEARWAFEHAIAANPRHFRSYIGLAQTISEMDDEQDVEPLYTRAVEIAPTFLQGRIVLGDYLAWSGQNDLATDQYLAAIEHSPRFETGYLALAANYLEIGNFDEAERAAQKALEINPRSYKGFYFLGNVWYARHDLNQAEQSFRQSLTVVPSFSDALYDLGTVLWEKDNIDDALAKFDSVLNYNPTHGAAYLSRAIIRSDRHQFREALQDSTQALKLYQREVEEVTKAIAKATKRGLARRADAQRKKKVRLEIAISRAQEIKTDAEMHSQ